MKTEGRRESGNVEDRRGGGLRGLPIGGRGIGLGTIVLLLVGLYFGVDPRIIMQLVGSRGPAEPAQDTPVAPPG